MNQDVSDHTTYLMLFNADLLWPKACFNNKTEPWLKFWFITLVTDQCWKEIRVDFQ